MTIRAFRGRTREIDDQIYLHLDDYAVWEGRRIPGDVAAPSARREGVVVDAWNNWINEFSDDGNLDLFGDVIGVVEHPCRFTAEKDYRTYPTFEAAGTSLCERFQALNQLSDLARKRSLVVSSQFVMSPLQLRIMDELKGNVLNGYELDARTGYDRRSLYHVNGIKELLERGDVKSDQKRGGYYRPDYPPSNFKYRKTV